MTGIGVLLAFASFWGFLGTNAQARMARRRLLADRDTLIAEAGRRWMPGPLWTDFTPGSKRRKAVISQLRANPKRWERYEQLRQELDAWNKLQSSVVLALTASIVVLLEALG